MKIDQLILKSSKIVISTTAAHAIVSKTGSAAIPIGDTVIIVRYILQGKGNIDNKAFKFIGDVCLFTGINTVCLIFQKKNSYRATKKNKYWKFAECVIPLMASMMVSGTIVSMTGLAAIPIGGALMLIGSNVPELAGEILYTIGCDILIGNAFRALKCLCTGFVKTIGYKVAKIDKKMTIGAKFLIGVGKTCKRLSKVFCKK